MTKIYVWPDASYLDADEYNEVEFNHKGEDLITIDLQDIAEGRTALVYTGGLTVEPVLKDRFSELLQAEHQLKTLTSMFRNYRNTMREMTWEIPHLRETIEEQRKEYALALRQITELESSTSSAEVRRLSRELSDVIASKNQEIKTILAARDQWVKELQCKLREATRLLNQSEEVNEELENRIAVLSARPPIPMADEFQEMKKENLKLKLQLSTALLTARDQWVAELQGKLKTAGIDLEQATDTNSELAEENRRLKSRLAGATARIRKQIDGYDAQAKLAEWKGRAEAAEAKLAKLAEMAYEFVKLMDDNADSPDTPDALFSLSVLADRFRHQLQHFEGVANEPTNEKCELECGAYGTRCRCKAESQQVQESPNDPTN